MDNVQKLVGKILSDEAFSSELLKDPQGALKESGIECTPEIIAAVNNLDEKALKSLAVAFKDKAAAG